MRRSMAVSILFVAAMVASVVASVPATATPTNVDVSRRHLNESEEAIAVNPTNPENIVVVTNVGHREAGLTAGMLAGLSFDGGQTWATRLIGNNDNLGDACCDPSLSFDQHGNLFLTYLFEVENVVPVALSTDGGLSFHLVANIGAGGSATASRSGTDDRGLFRFVDQPTITAGEDEAWVIFNAGGPMVATGARVMGLGQVGSFAPVEVVSGTNNCTYGDVAIGPSAPGGLVTPTVCRTTMLRSGVPSAPTAAGRSPRTRRSARARQILLTQATASTTATTRGCHSSVESPTQPGRTTPTARGPTRTGPSTSSTSTQQPSTSDRGAVTMGTPGIGQQDRASHDDPLRLSETIQGNILAPFNKPHQMFLFLNFNNNQDGARQWVTALTDN